MWKLYLLLCANNTVYTGITKDLDNRMAMHASGKGAKYVRAHLPFKLIYSESQKDHGSALKRELEVKKLPRLKKFALAGLAPLPGIDTH